MFRRLAVLLLLLSLVCCAHSVQAQTVELFSPLGAPASPWVPVGCNTCATTVSFAPTVSCYAPSCGTSWCGNNLCGSNMCGSTCATPTVAFFAPAATTCFSPCSSCGNTCGTVGGLCGSCGTACATCAPTTTYQLVNQYRPLLSTVSYTPTVVNYAPVTTFATPVFNTVAFPTTSNCNCR